MEWSPPALLQPCWGPSKWNYGGRSSGGSVQLASPVGAGRHRPEGQTACIWGWYVHQSINGVISKPLPDYSSHDGTAIRDYIHILDLATGHLQALNYLRSYHPGVRAWNLGTGKGSTVLEMIHAFSAAVGRDLPYEVAPRRPGDVLDLTSDPSLANKELGWKAERTLEDACEDLWRWTENNPRGYRQQPPSDLLKALPSVTTEEVKLEKGKKRKFTLS